jgi:hypothetical protein
MTKNCQRVHSDWKKCQSLQNCQNSQNGEIAQKRQTCLKLQSYKNVQLVQAICNVFFMVFSHRSMFLVHFGAFFHHLDESTSALQSCSKLLQSSVLCGSIFHRNIYITVYIYIIYVYYNHILIYNYIYIYTEPYSFTSDTWVFYESVRTTDPCSFVGKLSQNWMKGKL